MSRVVVIVAATDSSDSVAASLAAFRAQVAGRGRVVLVDGSRDGAAPCPGITVLRRPPDRLAPELWRDGLEATDEPLVAFSHAGMVPRAGWLDGLLEAMDAGAAVAGGPIAPGEGLSRFDLGLFLHRYANYLPGRGEALSCNLAGDNAIYRRDRLDGLEAMWSEGFWEVPIHLALERRGERLAFAPSAVVEFRGGGRPVPALRRRFAHARQYGASRASEAPSGRWFRALAAPLVPGLLLARIGRTLRLSRQPLGHWLPALPALGLILATWSLGEAVGACSGPPGRLHGEGRGAGARGWSRAAERRPPLARSGRTD